MTLLFSLRSAALLVAVALPLASGCSAEEQGAAHPTDRLDFPVAVTADPGGRIVWVTSGNFDLAWRGGAVLAIDVATHRFVPEAAFEVGSFPGPLTLLTRDGRAVAGYVLSREEDALYHVSLSGPAHAPEVSCAGGRRGAGSGATILHCAASEAITSRKVSRDDETVELVVGPDPVTSVVRASRAQSEPDLLLTGAMVDGNVASFTLDEAGAPTLVGNLDLLSGLFAFAERPSDGRIYASNKLTNALQILDLVHADPDVEPDLTNPWLALAGQVIIPDAIGTDRARDIGVSGDGTRLYATYRSPDTLLIVDISADATGSTANRVIAKVPLARDPGDLEVVPSADGSELVYVACYGADRVEVIDPARAVVVDGVATGAGPYGLAFVDNPSLGVRRLYVAQFNADSVGVIELDPASPYYHTEVAEIR